MLPRKERSVDQGYSLRTGFGGELLLRHSSCLSPRRKQFLLINERSLDRPCERLRVVDRNKPAALSMLNDLPAPTDVRCDAWNAKRRRLQYDSAKRLLPGGLNEEIKITQYMKHVLAPTEAVNLFGKTFVADPHLDPLFELDSFRLLRKPLANDKDVQLRYATHKELDGFEEDIRRLPKRDLSYYCDEWCVARNVELDAYRSPDAIGMHRFEVDTVVDHFDAFCVDTASHQIFRDGPRHSHKPEIFVQAPSACWIEAFDLTNVRHRRDSQAFSRQPCEVSR